MDALSGIRVLEFSGGLVGPVAADLMARMGAEVIKVESRQKVDFARTFRDPVTKALPKLNEERRFNDLNLNKLGVSVNVSKAAGVRLIHRLVAQCDVLLENFSAGTMDSLGLGYEAVSKLRPDIIMISASGSGHDGPDSGTLAVATIFAGMSGLSDLTGYPDGAPFEARGSGDATNSHVVVMAVMAALCHRQKTGQGQYIDYSSREGLSCLVADAFMDYSMNGRVQHRKANRDDIMAPHNCYRCKGEDSWVSIVVGTEEEWRALVGAMSAPSWAKGERFSDAFSRWQNQDELDACINGWTKDYTPYEIMEKLQKAGVAAFPTLTAQEFYSDPHLADRGVFDIVEHPLIGACVEMTAPWRLSGTPPQNRRHAPFFGEHNSYIFGELLGLTDPEIRQLEADEVMW